MFGPTTDDNRWTSTVAAAVPNDGIWRNYEFSIAESDLTFVPRVASATTYDQLIADVVRVMLRHDSGSPSSRGSAIAATLGIDNVRLVAPLLPGDGNLDGVVDGLDYLLWASTFGDDPAADPPGAPENGDYNVDGVVDGLDYLVWAGNFGQSVSATAVPEPGTGVPEPGTGVLLIMGAAMLFSQRSRRGKLGAVNLE